MIIEKFIELANAEFDDPGWMREFFSDIVFKRQYIVTVDDNAEITSFITYWKFGNKRWGYIRKCQFTGQCPKQMGKGKHLYVPLFWIREDRRGVVTIKRFIDLLKRECADATTLSWHDQTGRFITYKLIRATNNSDSQQIRRQDNGYIQEERRAVNAEC